VILDIVLPQVLPTAGQARMPALERWLARGDAGTLAAGNLAAILAAQYGLREPVPYAAISLAGEQAPGTDHGSAAWLRADPVHLEVGQVAARLHDASHLDVTPDEARSLTGELSRLFARDALEFIAPSPQRWYVRVPDAEVPVTTPLEEALRQNTAAALPRGPGRIRWPSVLTETQMQLAASDVNSRRDAQGKPAINSVWFWGGGRAPQSISPRYSMVYASEPVTRGLAVLSGAGVASVPAGYGGIDAVGKEGSVLLVLEDRASEALDNGWFVTLPDALRRFDVVHLLLPRGRDTLVARIGRGARWRWLRRLRALSSHA
jgi:hypothetical protein